MCRKDSVCTHYLECEILFSFLLLTHGSGSAVGGKRVVVSCGRKETLAANLPKLIRLTLVPVPCIVV